MELFDVVGTTQVSTAIFLNRKGNIPFCKGNRLSCCNSPDIKNVGL